MENSEPGKRDPKSFDTDVLVVGYGGAGAAAAIVAADLGAEVLIVEKSSRGGGNTRLSSGSIRTFGAPDRAAEHLRFLCGDSTDAPVIEALVRESHCIPPWLESLGGEVLTDPLDAAPTCYPIYPAGAVSPGQPGAEGVGPRIRVKGPLTANGRDLWSLLESGVGQRRIPILFNTPARRLRRRWDGSIAGLMVGAGREEMLIRARRAVILTCGGYERDVDLQVQFLGQSFGSLGASDHTGDGIRMAADAGASMWHMNAVAAGFGYRVPVFDCAILHTMPAAGFVYVDNTGRRFVDETSMDAHEVGLLVSQLEFRTMKRPRVPCYVVFDEATRLSGPVASTDRGLIADHYQWSRNNSVEVDKGWIKAGSNAGDLAQALGLDATALKRAIAAYNTGCRNRKDREFGRSAATLRALKGPLYGAALWPSLFNTQGGPRRNARAQILDAWGQPIKGLYGAGELGSMWSQNYPGAGNLTEALAFGRIAGRNAARQGES